MRSNKDLFRKNIEKTKLFIKPFLFLFFIYLIALFALFRSDVDFIDDINRLESKNGGSFFEFGIGYGRFLASAIGFLLYGGDRMYDISPFSQIIAICFIVLASIILVYIFCDRKIKYIPLFCTLPLGLSPFFIECFSYKIDAPLMALTVLLTVIPWIFIENRKKFISLSIICLLSVCLIYHVALGLFVIIAFFIFSENIKKTNNIIESSKKCFLIPAICFIITICLFLVIKTIFPTEQGISMSFNNIFPNMLNSLRYVIENSPKNWLILEAIIFILFIAVNILSLPKKYKVFTIALSMFLPIVLIMISPGVSLIMMPPEKLYLRYMFPTGAVFAIIMILVTHYNSEIFFVNFKINRYFNIPILYFSFSFIVFATAYGNALGATNDVINERNQYIHAKIVNIFKNYHTKDNDEIHFYMTEGEPYVGRANATINAATKYTPIYHLVNTPSVDNKLLIASFIEKNSTDNPNTIPLVVDPSVSPDRLNKVDEDAYYVYYVKNNELYIEIKSVHETYN